MTLNRNHMHIERNQQHPQQMQKNLNTCYSAILYHVHEV